MLTIWREIILGRSLKPSSNFAWVANLTRSLASSYQIMTRDVIGRYPRKIPFRASFLNRFDRTPGGRTWTRQPKVRSFVKLSFFSVAKKRGKAVWPRWGIAFRIRIAWWKAYGQNFTGRLAPNNSARTLVAMVLCALSTAPLELELSDPVGNIWYLYFRKRFRIAGDQ